MTQSRQQFVGQITEPGLKPRNINFVVNERPNLTSAESAAGIQWVDNRYGPGDIRRYGENTTPGTTDMSVAIRNATAANRIVEFQDEIYLVSEDSTNGYAVLHSNNNGLRIIGNGATIRSSAGDLQLLRNTGTGHFIARDLTFDGPGTNGADLSAGLLQINDANGVSLINVRSTDSDQDGIAISSCTRVHLFGCGSNNDSKAGIYVNLSTDVRIVACEVDSFGGHTASSNVVGTGIQLSGNTNLVCMACTIKDGVGTGIRCNNVSTTHPSENVIIGNRVSGCRNATNENESIGIRCTNGDATTLCGTVVHDNDVFDCGQWGIYMENHDGSSVKNNRVVQIDESGIVIGTITDCVVTGNDVWNCDTDGDTGLFCIQTINAADGVVIKDNNFRNSSLYTSGSAALRASDGGSGTNIVQNVIRALDNTGTPSILDGGLFDTGGTTAITDFDDGQIGDEITIIASHSVTITDGTPIVLSGSANYAMTDSDTLTLKMFDNQVWQETSRSVN